jgi:yersiniabactin nonribosomal peptide synthetase
MMHSGPDSHPHDTVAFLRATWADILDLDSVGDEDNFLDLGGDSIAAVLCINRVQQTYNVALSVESLLLDTLMLREIAALIDQGSDAANGADAAP